MGFPTNLSAELSKAELKEIIKAHFAKEGLETGYMTFDLETKHGDNSGYGGGSYQEFKSVTVKLTPKVRTSQFEGM